MSYQALARKWRPRSFAEMVGQTHVLRALVNALDNDRLHHAYLFSGTRGVGKTTIARIFAKSLNCERGVSSTPCGECGACIEINDGRFVDLVEVDAASRTRVDDTRDLLENVQYAPTRGRYKVYLIDEVHMFSNHSFNALLKTLEEPPPHVKFLLATTDPKKLPVTILSRCLQFNLKRLSPELIDGHLVQILEQEEITSDAASRHLLAIAADGSLRDALSLLDQAIAYGGGKLDEKEVAAMLGTIGQDPVLSLLEALALHDGEGVMRRVREISELNPDFSAILGDLLTLLQKIAIRQMLPESEEEGVADTERLAKLAAAVTAEECQLFYQTALVGRRDLPLVPDARSGFEMILLRMLLFTRENVSSDSESVVPAASVAPAPEASRRETAKPAEPEIAVKVEKPVIPNEEREASTRPSQWQQLIDELHLTGMARELANNCIYRGHEDHSFRLVLPPEKQHLRNGKVLERLQQALQEKFGSGMTLALEVADPAGEESPHETRQRKEMEKQKAAEAAVRTDPAVQSLCDAFDAVVDESSIKSVNSE